MGWLGPSAQSAVPGMLLRFPLDLLHFLGCSLVFSLLSNIVNT